MSKVARFGWELADVGDGTGGDAYFDITTAITLHAVVIDVAWAPQAATIAGPTMVFCDAAVSRGGAPTFTGGNVALIATSNAAEFGSLAVHNPAGLTVANDANPLAEEFLALSLRAFIPTDGTAGFASRNVTVKPNLSLAAGDYLAFHMHCSGGTVDAEMQVVLVYD